MNHLYILYLNRDLEALQSDLKLRHSKIGKKIGKSHP